MIKCRKIAGSNYIKWFLETIINKNFIKENFTYTTLVDCRVQKFESLMYAHIVNINCRMYYVLEAAEIRQLLTNKTLQTSQIVRYDCYKSDLRQLLTNEIDHLIAANKRAKES
jgi:hypothetical protein